MKILIFVFIAFQMQAMASDGGRDEALFTNKSEQAMYCYGDAGGTDYICQVRVAPGESCRGDGMGGDIGSKVFKAPNTTKWNCNINSHSELSCNATNHRSSLLTLAAAAANRFRGYYTMDWAAWSGVMGQKAVRKCDQNYNATSEVIWVPLGDEVRCDLKKK